MTTVNLGSMSYSVDVKDEQALGGLSSVASAVRKTESELNSLTPASAKASTALDKTGAAAKRAEKNTGALGQTAQNAAYQIQDFTAQVTLGTSPVLALSQQLPQLLGGLGATGAGIGAVVAILGGLYLALGDSTSASEKFEKAIEQAKATLTLSADGVAEYSDEMKKLAAISNTLAEIKLASTLANLTTGVKDGAKALQDITKDATNTINLFRDFDDVVKNITGKRAGAEGFEDAESAIKDFNFAVAAFVAQRTPENVRDLEDALNGLVSAGANSTKTGRELVTSAVDLIGQFREAEMTADQLKKGLEGLTEESGKSRESIEKMVESLQLQAETIGMTERETALYVASLKGANEAEVESINLAYDTIEAYEKKQQTIKDNAKSLDEYEAAIWRQMNAEAAQFEQEQRQKQQRAKTVTKQVEGIAQSVDPLTQLQAERDRRLALVSEYEQLETANHQMAVEARAAIDAQYEAQKQAAIEKTFMMQSESNEMLIGTLNKLSGTVSQVFTGMLTQTMSARDAVQGLANAVLNEAINALVQMGIQYVKNAMMKETADKAMLASEQSTKAIKAAGHTAAVTAQVTELVALGAMGAFAATSAIPIVGPALAPAASATAAAALTGMGSAAIAAAPLAGARNYGGSVGYGANYQFGEGGRTELYIPNRGNPILGNTQGGQVVSNSDLMSALSGGGNASAPVVNIYEAPPGTTADVQKGPDDRYIVNVVVGNINNRGGILNAITRNTTASSKVV